ncbi:hypothetical protein H8356DRAFT_1324369 [Neocallimastix lanati (nom. inval.)]|nr:hypothetical protein H8356DRAFT_1324369 [Neocallimastix sp. JGI-2020a]
MDHSIKTGGDIGEEEEEEEEEVEEEEEGTLEATELQELLEVTGTLEATELQELLETTGTLENYRFLCCGWCCCCDCYCGCCGYSSYNFCYNCEWFNWVFVEEPPARYKINTVGKQKLTYKPPIIRSTRFGCPSAWSAVVIDSGFSSCISTGVYSKIKYTLAGNVSLEI